MNLQRGPVLASKVFALVLVALAGWTIPAIGAVGARAEDKPYVVKDGKVDKAVYNGWRRYTESCLRCHGPDGAGSSYGPDLLHSLESMSEENFKEVVVNGRQNVTAATTSVMPPFAQVEDVMLYIEDIYAYLKARSDGVLGRGRPERFDR
ncbi:MAG: c-type cytochrome [Rhodospirillales bacterium]|nr:c-type cytochrome [Rhodospirillales bacterium]